MSEEVTPTPVARRRANAPETTETISVTIRPTFGEQKVISVPKDSTVEQLLSGAGYPTGSEVRLIQQGQTSVLTADAFLEDGDVIQIVSQKKITNG